MKGVILAGGKGTRLYPITLETPKPLITIRKRPILNYLVDMFRAHNVHDIKIIIRESDADDFAWWAKRYADELRATHIAFEKESEAMGTFGYVYHRLRDWLGNDPFFMTNGDELKRINLTAMKELHHQHHAGATVALVETPTPRDFGVAVLHEETPHIARFLEKPENPPTNFISSGTYFLDPAHVFPRGLSPRFLMIEKDILPALAETKQLVGYLSESPFYPCDNMERWQYAIEEWKE